MRYLFLLLFLLAPLLARGDQPLPESYKPPVLSTNVIIEVYDKEGKFEGIVLIESGEQKALPGGKVEYNESIERALRRQVKEETDLDLHELRQFHVYSEPSRDPLQYTVEVTYLAKAYSKPTKDDAASKAYVVPLEVIPYDDLSPDNAQILKDYITYREGQSEIQMAKP